jgi:Lipase
MVGKVGRHLKKISEGKLVLPRIYALDPAGPGFEDLIVEGMEAISMHDAKSVQIIHTAAGQAGMMHRVGTIDFYPNGGLHNPGCNVDIAASVFKFTQYLCDHARSWHFYQLSVRNPKAFPAIRCTSYDDFMKMETSGRCWKDDIAFMGFGANSR